MIGPKRGETGGVRVALPLIIAGLGAGVWGWTQGPEVLTGLGLATVLVGIVAWRGFGSSRETPSAETPQKAPTKAQDKPKKTQKKTPSDTRDGVDNAAQERLRRLNEEPRTAQDEAASETAAAEAAAPTSSPPRGRRRRAADGDDAEDPGPGERPVGHRRRENPYG